MNIFWPKTRYVPSGCGTARVRTCARSEPACGSVKFIVPVQLPSISRGRYLSFCSSEPATSNASIAPSVSSGQSANDRFAACIISMHAAPTILGRPCPPYCVGCWIPCHPASPNDLKASRKPGLVVTLPSSHLPGWVSPLKLSGAMTSPMKRAFSSSTACTVSSVASSQPGSCWICFSPASSFSTNSMSLIGAV